MKINKQQQQLQLPEKQKKNTRVFKTFESQEFVWGLNGKTLRVEKDPAKREEGVKELSFLFFHRKM